MMIVKKTLALRLGRTRAECDTVDFAKFITLPLLLPCEQIFAAASHPH
jgi:hypothetical protein